MLREHIRLDLIDSLLVAGTRGRRDRSDVLSLGPCRFRHRRCLMA